MRDVEREEYFGNTAIPGLRIDAPTAVRRAPRVGLLEGRTGVPVFLLFLTSALWEERHEVHSAGDVEARLAQLSDESDRAAWDSVLSFFEAEGTRALVHVQPRSGKRNRFLTELLGENRGLARRSGLHALGYYRETADLVLVPQASQLLGAEEHRLFHQAMFEYLELDPHFFFLADFPANFTGDDAEGWLRNAFCPDAASFFPWLLRGNRIVQPAPVAAAAIQRTDEAHGMHRLPANQSLGGTFRPLLRQTPAQLGNLVDRRCTVFHEFSGQGTKLWGGATLAPREDSTARFLSTRRTLLAVREAVHKLCEPFVLEPLYPGIEKTIDVALESAFEPLRRFFRGDAGDPFTTTVSVQRHHGQDVLTIDVRCALPYALRELNFTLGMAA